MVNADVRELQQPVSRVIQATEHRPCEDAAKERAKATFDVRRLAEHINDGAENITKKYVASYGRRFYSCAISSVCRQECFGHEPAKLIAGPWVS